MNVLQKYEAPATAAEIRSNVNLIQEVMASVMKDGVHYGTIPGTPKPTLYKPGAEKIFSTFRIAGEPEVEDLSTPDEIRYRVVFKATSQATGIFLGAGNGECSSEEEKYKWRKPVCDQEWEEASPDERREVWKRGKEPYKLKQVRIRPSDIANTILKMATKRAMVAACLLVTAASDVFDQDIEDLPEGYEVNGTTTKPGPRQPKRKSEAGVPVDDVSIKKQGTSAKGPYTIWTIVAGGVAYDTFSESDAQVAEDAKSAGDLVVVKGEDGRYGKSLKSISVIRRAEGGPVENEQEPGMETKLRKIASLSPSSFDAIVEGLGIENIGHPDDLDEEQVDAVYAAMISPSEA